MQVDAKSRIESALRTAIGKALPEHADLVPTLTRPRNAGHGDYATPDALDLGKRTKQNPRKLAETLVASASADLAGIVDAVDIAGPGFINFRADVRRAAGDRRARARRRRARSDGATRTRASA